MLIVQDKIVSDDVVEESFVCNLEACKGACCWEGDFGAPLERAELKILEKEYPNIRPFLSAEGQKHIDTHGTYDYFTGMSQHGTALLSDGRCAFLTFTDLGVAQCGIERAFKAGATDFQKPISCHLYPIRISENEIAGFEALNYDRWEICSAACTLGAAKKVRVYEFLKEPLIRKYGADFYEELAATATYFLSSKDNNNQGVGQ